MTTLNRSALKRGSAKTLLSKIQKSTEKKTWAADESFWQPSVDTNGNGFAVVRFLPAASEDSLPYVKEYSHGFKVNGKWFINLCPSTIGLPSPVLEHTNKLWETKNPDDEKVARARKRKLRYISNVLIIKDPKNPENEGKVFKFGYGQKIFEKLTAVMNPPEEFGDEPIDPFSFFDGANVKIKIKKVADFRNYDDTVVEKAGDLFGGDEEKLEEILGKLYNLDELISEDKFKDYEVLKTEYNRLIGSEEVDEGSREYQRRENLRDTSNSTSYTDRVQPRQETQSNQSTSNDDAGDDDTVDYWQKMVNDE